MRGNKDNSDSSEKEFVKNSGRGTAALRAIETRKVNNALINDPYAYLLAGKQGFSWVASLPRQQRAFFIDMIAVRTRVFDDYCLGLELFDLSRKCIEKVISYKNREKCSQIVIVGAGYDTRAYRLRNLNDISIFELDFREVLQEKGRLLEQNRIEPLCSRYCTIPIDIRSSDLEETLEKKGFNKDISTFWLIEGVTGYLNEKENIDLFKKIKKLSSKGSKVLATFIGESREAFGHGFGKSGEHVFFTDNSSWLFRKLGWISNQIEFSKLAEYFHRDQYLQEYDYWLTEAEIF